jgi:hypothetical protein
LIESNSEEIAKQLGNDAYKLSNIDFDTNGDVSASPLYRDYEMVTPTSAPDATITLNGETYSIQDDNYKNDSNSWEDERFKITVDIDIIKNFLYDQSKNEITIPVLNGDGIIKLDKKDAESIMDSFYENYPDLNPTSSEYEGPGGFGLNESK